MQSITLFFREGGFGMWPTLLFGVSALVLAVRHHHERYDGNGYPDGLAGEDIPPIARAMCVVDAYDAMSCRRPYKAGLTYSQCLSELQACRGTQFDPAVARAMVEILENEK